MTLIDTQASAHTRRFSVADVQRMVEAGVLREDEPIELLEGELVVTTPQGPEHGNTSDEIVEVLRPAYESTGYVSEQKPLDAGPDSQPEPDVAVVRGRPRDYRGRHPSGGDVILAIEVAVTSHALDRAKAGVYARTGVKVYWLVDVPGRKLEVYTNPDPKGGYRVVTTLADSERAVLPELGQSIAVAQLLP